MWHGMRTDNAVDVINHGDEAEQRWYSVTGDLMVTNKLLSVINNVPQHVAYQRQVILSQYRRTIAPVSNNVACPVTYEQTNALARRQLTPVSACLCSIIGGSTTMS